MIATLALAVSIAAEKGLELPQWYDDSLAGYALASDRKHGPVAIHDARSGFFLVRNIECDGADIQLVLTRDRKYVQLIAGESEGKFTSKRLPRLSTGKSLTIGDSEVKTVAMLGRPSQLGFTGARNQFRELKYKWTLTGGEAPSYIEEVYTFKRGRLIQIEFTSDSE